MVDLHLQHDCIRSADEAGLRYVSDQEPGIRRRRRGKGFSYVGLDGKTVDSEERARCQALGIPPAWSDVWICEQTDGHIQATGRDVKGRKQYRYHAQWNELRQMVKYQRLLAFAQALPSLREQVSADLRRRSVVRERVLAAVVSLMDRTLLRIGNAEYARDNDSFGLTTLREDHVQVEGDRLSFCFRGKSGQMREVELTDRRLARVVRQCQELRGQELFAYLDGDKRVRDVRSEDVNLYLRELTGESFSAKEFRTWGGSVRAFRLLYDQGPASSETERKKVVRAAIRETAARLGNTPTVCRTYYVHPVVLRAYEEGSLFEIALPEEPSGGLGRSEQGLVTLLQREDDGELLRSACAG